MKDQSSSLYLVLTIILVGGFFSGASGLCGEVQFRMSSEESTLINLESTYPQGSNFEITSDQNCAQSNISYALHRRNTSLFVQSVDSSNSEIIKIITIRSPVQGKITGIILNSAAQLIPFSDNGNNQLELTFLPTVTLTLANCYNMF